MEGTFKSEEEERKSRSDCFLSRCLPLHFFALASPSLSGERLKASTVICFSFLSSDEELTSLGKKKEKRRGRPAGPSPCLASKMALILLHLQSSAQMHNFVGRRERERERWHGVATANPLSAVGGKIYFPGFFLHR